MLTGLGPTGTMLFIVRLVFAFNDLVYNAAIGTGTAMTSGGPGGTSNDSFLFFHAQNYLVDQITVTGLGVATASGNVLAQSF